MNEDRESMKIIAVGGEPATGKTTLFRALLGKLGKGSCSKAGLVLYHEFPARKVLVLGDYRKEGFAGTDRLSMAVQPQALEFLRNTRSDWTVLFEGDRLFNGKFLESCGEFADITVWVLISSEEEKARRHASRGDTQSEQWLRGRVSKVRNIAESMKVVRKNHNTTEDTERLVNILLRKSGVLP